MTDQQPTLAETIADQERARSEQQEVRERIRSATLAELGVTPSENALFAALYYGFTIPPSDFVRRAVYEDCNPTGEITEEECQGALADCLAKCWLQVIDEPARTRINDELRQGRVLGPIYGGLPEVGSVDFTESGADLLRRLSERFRPDKEFTTYADYMDVVHEKTALFFRSSAAAFAAITENRGQHNVVNVSDPIPTGPWRAQWWRRFSEGFQVDIEQRRQWQGHGSGGDEHCSLDYAHLNADPNQLRLVLNRHNITFPEWLLLASMEHDWFRDSPSNLCRGAANSASRVLSVAISEELCREGLEACLRYGWLRMTDQHTADEVRSLLSDDPVVLAVPRIAQNRPRVCGYNIDPVRPCKLWALPMRASDRWGEIDFSPSGASLYRTISAEWLGLDWEDSLSVSRGYYWEEHHYCEAEDGFESVVQEHVAMGDVVRARRIVPIGSWCVHWWKRFPSGYRLELELVGSDQEAEIQ